MSFPIKPPPRGEDLPFSDGEPMESDRHVQQPAILLQSLRDLWRDRDDYYVATNMFVYFSETQAKKNDFRGPDLFVVMDTPKRERKSWVVWEEGGRTPDLVVEVLSASTEKIDRGDKMRIYAKVLRVAEYFLFDPFTSMLEAYQLDASTRSYQKRTEDAPGGGFSSAVTGLALGVRPGHFADIDAPWLRWLSPSGDVVPTEAERARASAAEEKARADEALGRIAELEARLRER